ncbi:MAG: fibronectin type III domain-containing protein, partial [Oscillospiraceae bacterium]
MRKRLLSLLLCVCMALSMLPASALAADTGSTSTSATGELVDEYGFAHSIPDDFNADDGVHPFGRNGDTTVNLNPVLEIGLLESASANYYSRVYNFNETSILKGESGGVFSSDKYYLGTSKNFTTAAAMSTQVKSSGAPLEYVSGVAWDPTGSGRDDYIAYYGTSRTSKNMQLYSFKASGGSMGSAKWTSSGTYSWMGTLSRYNAEGYTSIVAGDFNADGKDTLIFYDAAVGSIMLREYSSPNGSTGTTTNVYNLGTSTILKNYFSKTLNEIQAFNTSQARDTAMVQLEAGNIDDDDADELIVTVSLNNLYGEENKMTKTDDRSSVVMIFDRTSTGWVCTWSDQISNVYIEGKNNSYCVQNNGGWYMRAASSRIGDIDGDGTPEILVAGVPSDDHNNDDNFNQSGYIAVIIERNDKGNFAIETTTAGYTGSGTADIALQGYWLAKDTDQNNDWVGTRDDKLDCLGPTSLGIVRFDGLATQPYVVVQGLIFQYQSSNGQSKFAMAKMQDNGLDDMFHCRYIMRQPIVGNFDGNAEGREQILFVLSTTSNNDVEIGGWYFSGGTGNSVMSGKGLRSCNWETNAYIAPEVVLTAPDADTNDGMIAKYTGKEYTYTQPEIMAILEASPYFEDLADEYSETLGSTTFGTGKGSGSSTSSSSSTKAGAYVSFEQGIEVFGVEVASFEMEASFESEWSKSMEMETTWTYEMEFDAGRESNQVVLIYTPVIVYSYNVYNAATGKWEPMDITSAQQPVYTTLSVEDYNEAARLRGDPTIGSDIVSAVPGQPTTYRTTTAGLNNVVQQSNWMKTGVGSNTTTQSITKETSSTLTTELTHSIDTKVGGGTGGFTVGVSAGSSSSNGKSTTSTTSLTRSGTVAHVPTGFEDYSFEWKFICWDAVFGSGENQYTVPVLSYLVRNVQQPPSLPQNVSAVPESDSVTLTWDAGFNSAAEYEIFRYLPTDSSGKHYYKIGTVDGSVSTFTHTGLQSGTEYQYVLRSVGADGRVSNYTEPVAVVTATSEGAPTIVKQTKGTVSVLPGGTASFSVTATPVGNQGLSFSWQSRAKGQIAWKTLANEDRNTLTISGATTDMDGTEYRCMVSELGSGSSAVFIYSEAVKLSVGKAGATAMLTAKDDAGNSIASGSANYSTETETETEQTVTAQESVTVGGVTVSCEKYENTYAETAESIPYVYRSDEGAYYLENGTALSILSDCLTDSSGRIVAYLEDLHGTVQETETFGETVYNVFTATGVATADGETLAETTLTLYQKADGTGGYYTASYQMVGESLVLTLSDDALTATEGVSYPTNENGA